MAAPQPVTSTTPQRLPLRGDTMAEQLAGLRLPPGYRMWLSRRTARIRHATKRTGADLEDFTAWLERILPEKLRIECADGWVVVSGMPSSPHEITIARLDDALIDVARAKGWRRGQATEIWDATSAKGGAPISPSSRGAPRSSTANAASSVTTSSSWPR